MESRFSQNLRRVGQGLFQLSINFETVLFRKRSQSCTQIQCSQKYHVRDLQNRSNGASPFRFLHPPLYLSN